MKYYIYCGSTTDGQEHWLEFEEGAPTGGGRNISQPIGSFYPDIERLERRREYYPFLEPL